LTVLLNLQELELRPVPFCVDIQPGEIEFDGRLKQTSSVQAAGVAELLSSSLGAVRIRGRLEVSVESPCDRCLEAASVRIHREFDLRYFPAEQLEESGEDEIDEDASEVAYYEGNRLELNDILREVVLLALPMQLVCNEACKGICPACGQNRNLNDCRCERQVADDRWSKLRALRTEVSPGH
jgi:uncharacterized protein